MEKGLIGIVGGMGPHAGIALSRNIVSQTIAKSDSDHLPQILFSFPGYIPDRSDFIKGKIENNPGYPISDILLKMESVGAGYCAMACNSAHAPRIFDVVISELEHHKSKIKLFHMIREVGIFIRDNYPDYKNIGILGTMGTYLTRQYDLLNEYGLTTINISKKEQERLHDAIYHPVYGIKSNSGKIARKACNIVNDSILSLINRGAKIIVLGCTELPLVFTQASFNDIPVIDTSVVMARALIKAHSPNKLRPWI